MTGAGMGALTAWMTGQSVLQGLQMGAISGGAGALVNQWAGMIVGEARGGQRRVANGVVYYDVGETPITFGNVVIGREEILRRNNLPLVDGHMENFRIHELGHVTQAYGAAYLPLHGLFGGFSWLATGNWWQLDPLEVWFQEYPIDGR
jgi:hypothetical protein